MVLLDEQLHLFNVNYDIMICLIILYLTLFFSFIVILLFAFNDVLLLYGVICYDTLYNMMFNDTPNNLSNVNDDDDFHELNLKSL